MPKQAKFRPLKTEDGWRLNIPAKLAVSGKRERYFYRTKEAALMEAAKLRERLETFGAQASSISPSLAEQATKAAALLDPFGITLIEAAERVAAMEAATAASVTIENALAAFEKAKESKSAKQVQAITHVAKHLREDFAKRQISSITAEEITKHLDARTSGPSAFNAKVRLLVTLWRWCAKPPREWCKPDALEHIERKDSVANEVGTLTAAQASALMAAAEKHFPETVPAFAIALFTGMRQQEIDRLTASDISEEGITVPATSAKTKRRRFIQMPEPLAVWLKVYPVAETVTPANWQRKEKAVRRLAGWAVWSDLAASLPLDPKLSAEPPADAPQWPQNALRHTAASVSLALGKPLETLIFEHGHAGGLEMLRKHYIGKMPKREAMAIWSLGPNGSQIPNLKIA